MKILFTGGSSFTGYWFCHSLLEKGHKVVGLLTQKRTSYEGIKKERIEKLSSFMEFIEEAPFGSERMLNLFKNNSFDVLCHHGAHVKDYKSEQFDWLYALETNTKNIKEVFHLSKEQGLGAIILTGSVFEQNEGIGNMPLKAFSPYGLSKGLTSEVFRYYAERYGIPLGKFVIPNPFGMFEEKRFTFYLISNWKRENIPVVQTPNYIRDNIPCDLLASCYCRFVETVFVQRKAFYRSNPSCFIEPQGTFALRLSKEVSKRTGLSCPVELKEQKSYTEPIVRVNTEPAIFEVPNWSEERFWDDYVAYALENY
ncbi:NAD(P)-dependent oxidoreductase [Methylacidiphilum caldifontis]|uniref:NAD-dependent epimerase/dehydratase family protein n=1 Tax=Methylacidiphilum caldifontis TaxID=2795386 RepID=UPI001A8D4020|nr:NAD(P)-dependent oxidoreductase [Methylacidiphilum caldifontis]QSR89445.1 NAD(P)-dependent oxidoreductase [Methylacidiphilum caldifontis]